MLRRLLGSGHVQIRRRDSYLRTVSQKRHLRCKRRRTWMGSNSKFAICFLDLQFRGVRRHSERIVICGINHLRHDGRSRQKTTLTR